VTRRLDFSELTINEHYPESIQLSYEYSFGCETALLRSPEAFAELPSQQIRRYSRST